MRATIRVCACLLALIVGAAVEGRAQGFQGGIRGAVKDAGGVVPGAEVTLTNQGTSLSRSTTTNAGAASTPSRTWRPAPTGCGSRFRATRPTPRTAFRSARSSSSRSTSRSKSAPWPKRSRSPASRPIIETSNASTGTVLERRGAADAAVSGTRGVHDRQYGADRRAVRRRAVQPAAGSDQRRRSSRSAAARAAATTTRSTACRSPTCATARARTRRSNRSRT